MKSVPAVSFDWRRGVVVSGVRRINEVNARRARIVLSTGDRLRAGIPSRYVTSQLGQLSLLCRVAGNPVV